MSSVVRVWHTDRKRNDCGERGYLLEDDVGATSSHLP